ncbi:hypothetical protein Gohar_005049 [Gossypium harknessii]|uniref:Uncharacterized protein n=1 Tax=Gossypium harknessii TaxID=34285 RepID=A0A7J9H9D3_9ROSI|nr:hypothetical protein [Gossypium harknessii]
MGYVDKAVTDLFDRLDKGVTPIPAILAETFRSLSACRSTGQGRFFGCAQLLLVWFHSHFWTWKTGWRFFKISRTKILNGKPRGWCPMRSYINVGTSTGSLYSGYGEPLAMHRCWY